MSKSKKNKLEPITSEEAFVEALRFLKNAKETIAKSPTRHNRYQDLKYVRKASGIAYLAALRAIDGYLLRCGIQINKLPKSYEEYWSAKEKYIPVNGRFDSAFVIVYENLHLFAELSNASSVVLVKAGFENCKKIIEMLEKLK